METQIQTTEQEFKFLRLNNNPINLYVSPSLFMPNQTTALIAEAVKLNPGEIGIELGAGTGPLTVLLASQPIAQLYAVEIVKEQCELAKKNIEKYNLQNKVTFYQGSIFEPIINNHQGLKADFIVSDISGMSENSGRTLNWYPPHIPTGGQDGTEAIIPLIEQSPNFLKESGRLYFPIVVNFSYKDKILNAANEKFGKLEKIAETRIPLTGEMMSIVENLNSGVYKPVTRKGSRGFWELEIYEANEPKK